MIEAAGELRVTLRAALKADAGVVTAFDGQTVKVYDVPPDNAREPYVTTGEANTLDIAAHGLDLANPELTFHVWSQTDPPGYAELEAICPAVLTVMLSVTETANLVVKSAELVRTQYMGGGDGKTTHGVITVEYATEPKT